VLRSRAPVVKVRETTCIIKHMARKYELKRRAERREETHDRIVEAAIALHQTVGPAATTVSAIAARAGVGRVTVYRHFPDESALAEACSARYFECHPRPDTDRWKAIADTAARLRTALRETYAYHHATEAMMTRVLADARNPDLLAPYHAHWQRAVDVLTTGSGARGRRRTLLRAGLALALSFQTWRMLVRDHGLTDDQAIAVALRLTEA
jgi:AcrR family transcriptional regulator